MTWWSWALSAIGIIGLYLAGKKDPRGWAVGVFAQTLWMSYAVVTTQWGFIASSLAYGWVYVKNYRDWKK